MFSRARGFTLTHVVLVLGVALAASLGCKKEDKSDPSAGMPASTVPSNVPGVVGRRIDVIADENGFAPAEITVKKGEQATLVFYRTTDKTCATEVVFADLDNKKIDLPLEEPVVFVIPTDQSRKLAYACGMNMYKAAVIVQ